MHYEEPKKMPIALRYGLMAGLLIIIYSLILQFADMQMSKIGMFSYVFLLLSIILAYRDYKRQNQGFMSYGQGLGVGTLVALVAGVLSGVFTYINLKFIDTGLMDRAMEMQRAQLEEAGTMSDEEIEMAMQMGAKFSTPEMAFISAILGIIVIGFLMSLVIAAAMRNPRPEFE